MIRSQWKLFDSDKTAITKIGLDIHGLIDKQIEYWAQLTQVLRARWWEVHILTGTRFSNEILDQLNEWEIGYSHVFSISSYLDESDNELLPRSTPSNPWYSDKAWDEAKGLYCKEFNVPWHMDDTERYYKHFETGFAVVKTNEKKEEISDS